MKSKELAFLMKADAVLAELQDFIQRWEEKWPDSGSQVKGIASEIRSKYGNIREGR